MEVVSRSGNEVTVSVTVRLAGRLLEMEETIQEATNAVGCCLTEEALGRFDTDGSALQVGPLKWSSPSGHFVKRRSPVPRTALG